MTTLERHKPINTKSLREQVYDHLRLAMERGDLAPGAQLDLNEISEGLGISRTPLRDALLQLETEGFVTILPRRGCIVNGLTRDDIRELYQIIGSLEASVIRAEFSRLSPERIAAMRGFNDEMRAGLAVDDFDRYYAANLRFHDCYLELSTNERLKRIVSTMKQRLYDFPRKAGFVKEWELASTDEHDRLVHLIEAGDARVAADYARDVHWCYEVQRRFIEQYYTQELSAKSGA